MRGLMGVMCKWAYGNGCGVCEKENCLTGPAMRVSGFLVGFFSEGKVTPNLVAHRTAAAFPHTFQ